MPDSPATLRLIRAALREDAASRDVTSAALIPRGARARAVLLAKGNGVVAGLPVFTRVFSAVSPSITVETAFKDGDRVRKGSVVATATGPARALLAGERVALNLLSRLSGIATATRRLVDAAGKRGPVVLDTRKTTPGMRHMERYAVRMGGGTNHRFDLAEMVLIKDNHLALVGSVAAAVRLARDHAPKGIPIEVEVKDLAELREALDTGADRIMLDNMDLPTIRKAVKLAGGKVPLEVSGGVTEARVRGLAGSGVAFVSSGSLTHSAPAIDFSLELEPLP
jgi:nicotinate-nucleotide pyrophosphorylase (carboxylating)